MKSVAEWRRWFAGAENDTRTRQEIEDANGGTFPSAPYKTPQRFTMLGFAGDLVPVGVQAGVTPEQLEAPDQRYRLTGPNGMTCAEMLSDEYRREDDEAMNDEVELDPLGFSVIGVTVRGRGTYDSNVIGDPHRKRADIDRQFLKDGGISYHVRHYGDGRTGIFRGTGIIWDAPAADSFDGTAKETAVDFSERAFLESQHRKAEAPPANLTPVALVEVAKTTLAELHRVGVDEHHIEQIRGQLALQIGQSVLEAAGA